MTKPSTEALVNEHFEQLNLHGVALPVSADEAALHPELNDLLFIAQWLWTFLRPIKPSESFRSELHANLIAEAERQRALAALSPQRERRHTSWLVATGAAVGTASLVGVYAWRRVRHLQRMKNDLAA